VSSQLDLPVSEEQPSLAFDAEGRLHLAWVTSGARLGIAHAVWDGATWAAPMWTETGAGSPVLLANGDMRVLWLEPDQATPVAPRDVGEIARPLSDAMLPLPAAPQAAAMAVANRHLAHGDSITWGGYDDPDGSPATPYPVVLEQLLDSNVVNSEVINHGKPGEKARAAEARLREGMELYQSEFVQILEGTNDLTAGQYSPAETSYHVRLLIRAVKEYPGAQVVVSTLIPRLDKWNGEVAETNQLLKRDAGRENVPIADAWQAFYNYGTLEELFTDDPREPGEKDRLHPNSQGLAIIANTFFQKMVEVGMLPQDPNPPTAQITSLPSQSGCFVPVQWTGDDGGGSGIATFDVQVQVNGGAWAMWLPGTPQYSGFYIGADGQNLSFRVRARDKVGNVGEYSAPRSTQVRCDGVIYRAHLPTVKRNSAAAR
jgi:lysophospholipase L1-like esterase